MNQVESKGARRGRAWLAALSTAGFLFAAPEARAGDEFEDGFKDELGRLAAHEAVVVGRGVLAGILLGGYPGYYPAYPTHRPRYYDHDDHHPRYRPYPGWHYGGYGYGYGGHGHGHHRHHHHRHVHHHYHHHGCDH